MFLANNATNYDKYSRCYNTAIGDEGAQALSVALTKNTCLKSLKLAGNQISDEGAKAFSVVIEKNKTLNNLDLANQSSTNKWATAIKDIGASVLMESLEKSNNTLISVNLCKNISLNV